MRRVLQHHETILFSNKVSLSPILSNGQLVQIRHFSLRSKYDHYMKRFDNELYKFSPKAHMYFNTFKNGIKDAETDIVGYYNLVKRIGFVNNKPDAEIRTALQSASLKDVSILRRVPRELIKTSSFLVFFLLPGTFLLIPLIFIFPRFLLKYFWTDELRREFIREEIYRKKALAETISIEIKRSLSIGKSISKGAVDLKMNSVLAEIRNRGQIKEEDVDYLSIGFESALSLPSLSLTHQVSLFEFNGISSTLGGLEKFQIWKTLVLPRFQRSINLKTLLIYLENEKILANPALLGQCNSKFLDELCHSRGMYSFDSKQSEKISFLMQYARLTKLAKTEQKSLQMHMPLFYSLNSFGNRALLAG